MLRGSIPALGLAGVKVVGDFVENYRKGLPSEMALLCLFDPSTGMPKAIVDATAITEMRTGAMTAIGARHLARSDAQVLGHVGARGTAYWNVRLLDRLFGFREIRVHSRRRESREEFARRLSVDLGKPVRATEDWRSCVEGADIVVEASRLSQPDPLLKTEWISPGALVVPYGTMSAVELSLTEIMDKVVVDDWGQCATGELGALRPHVQTGRLTRETLHAELCEIVVGKRPGRESLARRSCSGIADCHCRTSHWPTRCSSKPSVRASGQVCDSRDHRRLHRACRAYVLAGARIGGGVSAAASTTNANASTLTTSAA